MLVLIIHAHTAGVWERAGWETIAGRHEREEDSWTRHLLADRQEAQNDLLRDQIASNIPPARPCRSQCKRSKTFGPTHLQTIFPFLRRQ